VRSPILASQQIPSNVKKVIRTSQTYFWDNLKIEAKAKVKTRKRGSFLIRRTENEYTHSLLLMCAGRFFLWLLLYIFCRNLVFFGPERLARFKTIIQYGIHWIAQGYAVVSTILYLSRTWYQKSKHLCLKTNFCATFWYENFCFCLEKITSIFSLKF